VPAGYALARARTKWAIGIAYFFSPSARCRWCDAAALYMMMRDIGLLGTWWR